MSSFAEEISSSRSFLRSRADPRNVVMRVKINEICMLWSGFNDLKTKRTSFNVGL